jgi:hypothetical protein
MTFLLSEDDAMRKRLQGMTVQDQKSDGDDVERQVRAYFGQPDQEITPQLYPYITIDLLEVQRDNMREMRGTVSPSYLSKDDFDPETEGFEMEMPIPVYLTYQITTYSRHPRHDRAVLSQLMTDRLPRFGYLEVVEKSATVGDTTTVTSTFRRMDVINVTKRDVTEQAKRLFVNSITVRVSSEIAQGLYRNVHKALEVQIDNPTEERAGGTTSDPYFIGINEGVTLI